MQKFFTLLTLTVFAASMWAGEKTVVFAPGVDMGASYVVKDGIKIQMYGMNNSSYYEQAPGGTGGANTFTVVTYNHLIKSIEFTCIGSDTEDYGPGLITSFTNQTYPTGTNVGTYTYSGHEGKWSDGLTQSIHFIVETGRIVRFGEIKVTYYKDNGDIYDLVTTHDELIEDGKYVIVSKYYDKAMSSIGSLENGEITAYDKQAVDVVEWLNDDKTKVKVDDNAQVITLKNVAEYNSTNVSANYSIVDGMLYLRNTSDQIVNTANPYTFYTWLNTTNNNNALIRNTTSTNMAIRYDATDDIFTFKNYNNSTYERVYLYKQAQNYDVNTVVSPEDAGEIVFSAGVVEMDGQNKSQQFETVAFTVNGNEGYELQEVTVVDPSGEPVEFAPMRGDDYSFVMPAANVTITATFADALTAVSRVDTARAVQSVTYSDLAGRTGSKPFAGVNIVITRYTDGTVVTSKQVR